jgi:integrase
VLLSAQVKMGYDVAGEKQSRKADALAAIEAERQRVTVLSVIDDYFEQMIKPRRKDHHALRQRIDKDIVASLGTMEVGEVQPTHIDAMLRKVMKRNAPAIANDILRWSRRIFDFAVKRHLCLHNPARVFDVTDAGGREQGRDRALNKAEIIVLFKAMRTTDSFGRQNYLTVKLLLLLAVRKNELLAALWEEFNLESCVWHLPSERTKTKASITIPLSEPAMACLRELNVLACSSDYVLPARKSQKRHLPHIGDSTMNMALQAVELNMPEIEHFTVHDLRRTARTHLAGLGVPPHIAEKCLNHKLKGIEGRYDRYDYFEERKAALNKWADLVEQLEEGGAEVIPLHERRRQAMNSLDGSVS